MEKTKRRRTIGENPLDTLVPPQTAPQARARGQAATDGAEESHPPPRVVKERLTVHVPVELIERVKNAVYWTPGLTLAGLAEAALTQAVDALEKEQGEPYPPRKENLKGGRPMK